MLCTLLSSLHGARVPPPSHLWLCCGVWLDRPTCQALEDGYLNVTGIAPDVGVDDDDEDYETVLKTTSNTNSNNHNNNDNNDKRNSTGDGVNDYDQYADYERMQAKPGGTAVGGRDDATRPYNAVPAGTAMTYDAADAADQAARPSSDVKEGSKEYVAQQGDLGAYIATGGEDVPQAQDRKCKYANAQGRKCFNRCTSPNLYCKNHTCSAAGCGEVTNRLCDPTVQVEIWGPLGSDVCCSLPAPAH